MGLTDKLRHLKRDSNAASGCAGGELQSRQSTENFLSPQQVTEQSLQVWRSLPAQIRHDPSMVSFQMESERLHGTDDESNNQESSYGDDRSCEGVEFINMKRLSKPNTTMGGKSPTVCSECELPSDVEFDFSKNRSITDQGHDGNEKHKTKQQRERERTYKRYGLLVFWVFVAVALMVVEEKHLLEKTLAVPRNGVKHFLLPSKPTGDFKLNILGAFNESIKYSNESDFLLKIQPQISMLGDKQQGTKQFKDILQPWYVPIVTEAIFDIAPVVSRNFTFKMTDQMIAALDNSSTEMRLSIYTNAARDFALQLTYNPLIINVKTGTLLAAVILLVFYALLVWEVFERAFVAVICSTFSIAVLACFNDRPNMEEIIKWMDMEMLTLLFCMMIIVGILMETGVFDYIAVLAFEISGGKAWPMIFSLCAITCVVSGFLDNVTTVLLMTPVTIRLCEVMCLNPEPVLMGIIAHANIGGSLTPIGDPISIIICSNQFITKHGVAVTSFIAHTLPGVVLTVVQSCIYLRLVFRSTESLRLNEPKEIKELRREIKVWRRAANSISSYSKDAELVRTTLLRKVKALKQQLRRKLRTFESTDVYVHTLEDLKLKYPIKDKLLLLEACGSLMFVILCFFIQSVPHLRTLPLGWVALLGVIVLLIILNREDMEHIMHRIEWPTLLFFAAMFVMMECVERLGLFTWIGDITENIILFVDEPHRLAMALFVILWISALTSSVLDSIPVTVMMVKTLVSLVGKESLGLPLQPLVWALVFGSSLGGNGTLYGASSNVISAGIAEQHGYKITFTKYFRVGFPLMLGQITIITAYLMVAHILFEWH